MEHTRTQWSQVRLGELVPQGGDDRRDAQDDDHRQVDHFVLVVTVETIVQPRNKRTHDEQRDSAVVQSGEGQKCDGRTRHRAKCQTDRILTLRTACQPSPSGSKACGTQTRSPNTRWPR